MLTVRLIALALLLPVVALAQRSRRGRANPPKFVPSRQTPCNRT